MDKQKAGFTLIVNGVRSRWTETTIAFQGKLEEVYPTRNLPKLKNWKSSAVDSNEVIKAKETIEKPVVYIPVFRGNSEYDSAGLRKEVQRST